MKKKSIKRDWDVQVGFKVMPFLHVTAVRMKQRLGCDYNELLSAGIIATYYAFMDGEITLDGTITKGGKRYIR